MKPDDQLDPTAFVIFGGAGDLTWRKLMPSLFDLARDGKMPKDFAIVAVDHIELDEAKLRDHFRDGAKQFSREGEAKDDAWKPFAERIHYHKGDFKNLETYKTLGDFCAKLEGDWKTKTHRVFYMATPPSMFGEIPKQLGDAGLAKDRESARIVVEKPIGRDLESARSLNAALLAHFNESQVFRIDHYLGKETVQNILAFRFANPIFEPIWDRRYVEDVTITVAETVGIGHRGGYYEGAGALRDMVQNHLMQLVCLVAMEPMVSFDADEIRNKKVDVLHAIRPIAKDQVHQSAVRGQYGKGWIEGKEVKGYRAEEGVAADSQTETFAALKLFVDNWRWQDVPFYLRSGKRLARQASEIAIQFRAVPHRAFPSEAALDWQPARLVMLIHPEEGIRLRFQARHPGPKLLLKTVEMRFDFQESFHTKAPGAYETLLWDVMKGDATLFMRADQIEAAWKLLTPVLEVWSAAPPGDFPNYAAGTWGPETAQGLIARQGQSWPLPIVAAAPHAPKPKEDGKAAP